MLESLKQVGRTASQGLGRALENISEGWHELLHRSSGALTHFAYPKEAGGEAGDDRPMSGALLTLPRWSLLAGEIEETGTDIVVRVELPGMDKEDCQISIRDNTLYLSGEKYLERDSSESDYHVMERAYGRFERVFALPKTVSPAKAEATYRNGVLTVRLPKENAEPNRFIPVA